MYANYSKRKTIYIQMSNRELLPDFNLYNSNVAIIYVKIAQNHQHKNIFKKKQAPLKNNKTYSTDRIRSNSLQSWRKNV